MIVFRYFFYVARFCIGFLIIVFSKLLVIFFVWIFFLLKCIVSVCLLLMIDIVFVVFSVLEGILSLCWLFLVLLLCSFWKMVIRCLIFFIGAVCGGNLRVLLICVICCWMIFIFFFRVAGRGMFIVLKWWCKVLDSLLMFWLWLLVVVIRLKFCCVCIFELSFGMGSVFLDKIVISVFCILLGMWVSFFIWVIWLFCIVIMIGLGIRVFFEGLLDSRWV